jgi:hypothetical protein
VGVEFFRRNGAARRILYGVADLRLAIGITQANVHALESPFRRLRHPQDTIIENEFHRHSLKWVKTVFIFRLTRIRLLWIISAVLKSERGVLLQQHAPGLRGSSMESNGAEAF